jgi:hypothetical protein
MPEVDHLPHQHKLIAMGAIPHILNRIHFRAPDDTGGPNP